MSAQVTKGLAAVLALVALSILSVLLAGGVVMILVGVLHGSVSAGIPALGYGASVILTIVTSLLVSLFRRS